MPINSILRNYIFAEAFSEQRRIEGLPINQLTPQEIMVLKSVASLHFFEKLLKTPVRYTEELSEDTCYEETIKSISDTFLKPLETQSKQAIKLFRKISDLSILEKESTEEKYFKNYYFKKKPSGNLVHLEKTVSQSFAEETTIDHRYPEKGISLIQVICIAKDLTIESKKQKTPLLPNIPIYILEAKDFDESGLSTYGKYLGFKIYYSFFELIRDSSGLIIENSQFQNYSIGFKEVIDPNKNWLFIADSKNKFKALENNIERLYFFGKTSSDKMLAVKTETTTESILSYDLFDYIENCFTQDKLIANWKLEKQDIYIAQPPKNILEILLSIYKVKQASRNRCYSLEIERKDYLFKSSCFPHYFDWDPYHATTVSIDHVIQNLSSFGGSPNNCHLGIQLVFPLRVFDEIDSSDLGNLVRVFKAISTLSKCYAFQIDYIEMKPLYLSNIEAEKSNFPLTLLVHSGTENILKKEKDCKSFKEGDLLYLIGNTGTHLAGSLYYQQMGWLSQYMPQVNPPKALAIYEKLAEAIKQNLITFCHPIDQGGLAVALCEIFSDSLLGCKIQLDNLHEGAPELRWDEILFSESSSRFILIISGPLKEAFETHFKNIGCYFIGEIISEPILNIGYEDPDNFYVDEETLLNLPISRLKSNDYQSVK